MDLRLFQNAQARGSRAAKGSSASVRWHTIQPEAEGAASDDPPKKKKKIQHDVFTQRQTGGVSSCTSFVNANASPTKSQRHKQTVDWIDTPCDNPDKQELCWVDPDFQDYIEDISINPRKRKRTAGDDPLRLFVPEIPTFLDEFIRLEGRGDSTYAVCPQCAIHEPKIRCLDCLGGDLLCTDCSVSRHRHNPLHRIQEWNGQFFQRQTLKSLGLRIQLGHPVGQSCVNPKRAFGDDFVVLDTHSIHEVGLDFCDCEAAQPHIIQLLRIRWFPSTVTDPKSAATFQLLEHFHLLTFESKTSAFEAYQTISRATENLGINPPKNRYEALLRMVREWRHIKMLKRAGRGHDPDGVEATREGECAVLCPACPQPGKNLPEGWESAPPEQRWVYALFLALDANFRLQREDVSSDKADPGLSKGYSYFVEETKYKAHLKEHSELPQEPSTCVSHTAVNNANIQTQRGLAATGAGTVDCARHDMKRPTSVGDLQRGEKYINMDYMFFSSLEFCMLFALIVSYDIVCQWYKNLWTRMSHYRESFNIDREKVSVKFLVPKFHLPAHIDKCHTSFSFNLTKGVARTDGEAPERGWSFIDPAAPSTKLMSPGQRRETLDDHWGGWNWKKVIGMGIMFLRKIKDAVPSASDQACDLEQLTDSLPPEAVAEWKAMVERWEEDNSNVNPFEVKVKDVTQVSVRLALAEEEAQEMQRDDSVVVHNDISPSVLINSGMELEEQQRRLKYDRAHLGMHSTDLQRSKIKERSNAVRRKIKAWRKSQKLYMPEATILREKAARAADRAAHLSSGTMPEEAPEDIPLWLPSSIGHKAKCDRKLQRIEFKLREAQAHDALRDLRRHLLFTSHLWGNKRRFTRGQGPNTRARTLIQRTQGKTDAAAEKYRVSYKALVVLGGILGETEWQKALRPLTSDDVRGMSEGLLRDSEGRRTLSWIWTIVGIGEKVDRQLDDALRIEWCKTRARANRWSEEVKLLKEEMHRVLAFLLWHAGWWIQQSQRRMDVDAALKEGLSAYAHRQAAIRQSLHDHFAYTWRYVDEYIALGVECVEGEDVGDLVAECD